MSDATDVAVEGMTPEQVERYIEALKARVMALQCDGMTPRDVVRELEDSCEDSAALALDGDEHGDLQGTAGRDLSPDTRGRMPAARVAERDWQRATRREIVDEGTT